MPLADRLPSVAFPADVPTAPLRIVDYARLVAPSTAAAESAALFQSATELGFFYLANTALDYEPLKDACTAVFALPEQEKELYDVGRLGTSFGFKRIGADNTDEQGAVDTNEQFNVSRDDLLAFPARVHNAYPAPIDAAREALLDFTTRARAVAFTLLEHFERHLGLPDGALRRLHDEGPGKTSPTKARVIRNPPQDDGSRLALGSHTDFGSIVRSPGGWFRRRACPRRPSTAAALPPSLVDRGSPCLGVG